MLQIQPISDRCGPMVKLKEEHSIDPKAVEKVDVYVVEEALPIVGVPRKEKTNPKKRVDAQFSLPYSVSVTLKRGKAGYEEFSKSTIEDKDIGRLAKKVNVHGDPELSLDKWPSRVEIKLKDRTVSKSIETSKGDSDPENPLSLRK